MDAPSNTAPPPDSRPHLPPGVIDRLWNRMHGIFGAQWTDKWRTGEATTRGNVTVDKGTILAKAVWATDLAGYADRLPCIWSAAEACSARQYPPNLAEFRALVSQYAQQERFPPMLPAPHPGPDVRQRNVAGALAALAGKLTGDQRKDQP